MTIHAIILIIIIFVFITIAGNHTESSRIIYQRRLTSNRRVTLLYIVIGWDNIIDTNQCTTNNLSVGLAIGFSTYIVIIVII